MTGRILVLGGSVFVGHAVIEAALLHGWRVTAFNNDPGWLARSNVEHIVGDRHEPVDVARLSGQRWDLVVDTWTGPVQAVRLGAIALSGCVGSYVYISSLTVYRPQVCEPLDETSPVIARPLHHDSVSYAERKLDCERAVAEAFPDGHLIIRAGLLLGPREAPGRLPWWLRRMHQGGEVLAPAPRARLIQYADVRDLAAWSIRSGFGGLRGVINFACPRGHTTMAELIEACRSATGEAASIRWVDPQVLLRNGVLPWTGLPLWIPTQQYPSSLDIYNVDVSKAVCAGAEFRPLAETVQDTQAWLECLPSPGEPAPEQRGGRMTRAQEEEILNSLR
ncbi:NAD-dependent epimerase/dehydratase family protein [Streptomyces sp. NPDC006996]|uniref:NAD-dependent epimerase/dehydratase family protein n=1 Tax=Streptomyces sp. NPDC006996 TaxID=3156908 RepID=UPI0033F96F07